MLYGADRAGTVVPWITAWPVSREAVVVVDLGSGDEVLFVQFHNHVPLATELAHGLRGAVGRAVDRGHRGRGTRGARLGDPP